MICTGTAASGRLPTGRLLRERRVHPGAPHRDPRRRQAPPHLARARAARAAASGSRRTRATSAIAQGYPGEGARLHPRADVPGLRQPRPARHRHAGDLQDLLPRGPRHLQRQDRRRTRTRSTSISPTRTRRSCATSSPASSRSTRSSRASIPYKNPMKVFPAVHYSMGGLWVDFEARRANGSLEDRLAAEPRDQHPRASTRSARSTTSTTAPIASARTRCSRASRAGWRPAPPSASYQK